MMVKKIIIYDVIALSGCTESAIIYAYNFYFLQIMITSFSLFPSFLYYIIFESYGNEYIYKICYNKLLNITVRYFDRPGAIRAVPQDAFFDYVRC